MSSIFTKIINREIPGHIVAEDDSNLAFLDINPLVEGHTLVVPKKEVDYIIDLDDDTYTSLHLFVKKVARAIDQVIDCERVGITVIGVEVPHAHIHLIPFKTMDDMNFARPKLKLSDEQLAGTAAKINKAFQAL